MAGTTLISRTADFAVGESDNAALWQDLPWLDLIEHGQRMTGLQTRTKLAWSATGIYVLIESEDRFLTCKERKDFDDIFNDDVVEIFLRPDPGRPLYFEYEVSPLGVELVLLIPNNNGIFMGWRPWHYEKERLDKKRVWVDGGKQEAGAAVKSWTAEIFIPFKLFKGLIDFPPRPGSCWRGNVCRMDFDAQPCAKWSLTPQADNGFHSFKEFGILQFA